ncbi:hypothetical protein Mapa_018577 [Marchantia paleacea]|nr:hypothetical protein Mapa_018577 [Marchantia paleacea]
MAVKKMSQLVIASLVIGLTLLPLAAARKIDTKDNLVSHVEISASNLVLEPPRGRMINQVAVPVQTSKSEQPRFADLTAEFGDNDDKDDKDDESDKAVEEMVRKTLYHMKINSTGNSTTDLENAMSGIFGTIIQEDIALYKAIGAIIQQAIKDQEEYAKAVECLLKEMIKQAHDKAELKQKVGGSSQRNVQAQVEWALRQGLLQSN